MAFLLGLRASRSCDCTQPIPFLRSALLPVSYTHLKLEFYPKVFRNLGFIRSKLDFEFVMVTNQDGLGTSSFPEDTFWPVHNLVLKTLEGEGIIFDDILIAVSYTHLDVYKRQMLGCPR